MTDAATPPSDNSTSNQAAAAAVIKRYATYSAVTGLIPLPVIDAVVLTGIQVKMISALAQVYQKPFSDDAVKSYATAIVAGVLPVSPIAGAAIRAVRYIPFIGPLMGIAVVPAFASALTWAVGKVFANHFESGKDLFNVDINDMKDKVKRNITRSGRDTPAADAAAVAAAPAS
jgi:uncharacterized protein (DUF697 family)